MKDGEDGWVFLMGCQSHLINHTDLLSSQQCLIFLSHTYQTFLPFFITIPAHHSYDWLVIDQWCKFPKPTQLISWWCGKVDDTPTQAPSFLGWVWSLETFTGNERTEVICHVVSWSKGWLVGFSLVRGYKESGPCHRAHFWHNIYHSVLPSSSS